MMTAAERAQALLADLLKDGPREAAQILAAADGANIAGRTMQRAAEALGVVKTRAAFRSGWTWRLPAGDADAPAAQASTLPDSKVAARVERAEVIAARLRKLEAGRGKKAPIYAADPRLLRWVEAGISDPDLREAYERAAFKVGGAGPVTVGHLDKFVAEVLAEAAD